MAKKNARSQADDGSAPERASARAPKRRKAAPASTPDHVDNVEKAPTVPEIAGTFAAGPAGGRLQPDPPAGDRKNSEPPRSEPTDEEIRKRAYQLYLARGRSEGRAFDDWVRAKAELQKK